MDDDPDDLAAAFFAQQAAKEKAKATLPTDDWIRVIDAIKQSKSGAGGAAAAAAASSDDGMSKTEDAINPSSWLVTTMPSAPSCHTDDGNDDGIVGIILDSSDARCSLGNNALEDANVGEREELASAEEDNMRCRINEYLVQRLEMKEVKR